MVFLGCKLLLYLLDESDCGHVCLNDYVKGIFLAQFNEI